MRCAVKFGYFVGPFSCNCRACGQICCKTCAPKREASTLAVSLREQKLFRADKPTKAKRVCTRCMPDAQASAAQKQDAAAKQDAATAAFKKQLREQMAREEAEASIITSGLAKLT